MAFVKKVMTARTSVQHKTHYLNVSVFAASQLQTLTKLITKM